MIADIAFTPEYLAATAAIRRREVEGLSRIAEARWSCRRRSALFEARSSDEGRPVNRGGGIRLALLRGR
jgi:hypothetical protein